MTFEENNYYLVPDLLKATLVSGRMCALKTLKTNINKHFQHKMVYQGHGMLIIIY